MDVGNANFRFTLDDPEDKSRAFRYPMSAELHLSSLDRYGPVKTSTQTYSQQIVQAGSATLFSPAVPTSGTDCVIQTKRALLYGYFNRVAISEMQLLLRMPTVVAGYNDRLQFSYFNATTSTGTTASILIPQGYYTPVQLAAQLQAQLRIAVPWTTAASFTVTPPSNGTSIGTLVNQTGFVFATGTSDRFALVSPFDPLIILTIPDAYKLQVLRFNRLIGAVISNFRAMPTPPAGVTSITTQAPIFFPTDYVDIVSKKLTNYKETKDTNSSYQAPLGVLGRVYLTDAYTFGSFPNSFIDPNSIGPTPMTFTKKWPIPNWSQWSPNQAIDSVDITLLDMWGTPLPWDNTVDMATEWQMTLVASE